MVQLASLRFVKRILFDFNLISPQKALFYSLGRPLLEYGSDLQDSHAASNNAMIDLVQRHFLSYAGLVLNIPHPLHKYSPILPS
ncbi:Uncharacterized protein FWK35_00021385 [Aphis craccivora]|uniref:Uncharacterized protein n=1 Tax=Aphis craccivora TaxID=307492 RepID=A0A6G0YIC6_APHCR|nr:Uncharacterized protein FWK35_00021385 [Aphis craccivora]